MEKPLSQVLFSPKKKTICVMWQLVEILRFHLQQLVGTQILFSRHRISRLHQLRHLNQINQQTSQVSLLIYQILQKNQNQSILAALFLTILRRQTCRHSSQLSSCLGHSLELPNKLAKHRNIVSTLQAH